MANWATIVAMSDLHCGHQVGLTHPDYNPVFKKKDLANYRLSLKRSLLYKFYKEELRSVGPVETLLVVGDAVDGKGQGSGGTELITADRNEQADWAAAAIEEVKARNVLMVYGTPFHTGVDEDWEDVVADKVNAHKIGGEDWYECEGVVFNYKHQVGRSTIPHGRYTALARAKLWQILWTQRGEYPDSDILLRAHVHYHVYCGDARWFAATLPALQAAGTKLGSRRCEGTVDFGFLSFKVRKGEWKWKQHIQILRAARQSIIRL